MVLNKVSLETLKPELATALTKKQTKQSAFTITKMNFPESLIL